MIEKKKSMLMQESGNLIQSQQYFIYYTMRDFRDHDGDILSLQSLRSNFNDHSMMDTI